MADPVTIISAVAACSEIVKVIVKITTNLTSLRSRWSEASGSLQFLLQKLSTVRAALNQIKDWADFNISSSPTGESLRDGFSVAIEGCQAVMEALDRDLMPLVGDTVASRLRQFFLDSSLKEHDSRLQSQISVLQLLLSAAYCQNVAEQNSLLKQNASQQLFQKIQDDTSTLREQSTVRETATEPDDIRDDATGIQQRDAHSDSAIAPVVEEPKKPWQRPRPFERLPYPESLSPSEKTSRSSSLFSRLTMKSVSTSPSEEPLNRPRSSLTRRLSRIVMSTNEPAHRDQASSPKSRRSIRFPGALVATDMYLQSHDDMPPPKTIVAAQRGDVSEMTSLIRRRANIEQTHPKTGRTSLAVASHCGHEDIVELLLTEGANLKTRDKDQLGALHLAAANGHCQVLETLLARESDVGFVNFRGPQGKTPLRIACEHGQLNGVRTLVRHQAVVNSRDQMQRTSLHFAAEAGDDEVVRLLLQNGADKDAKDAQMRSPLHCACAAGRIDVVKILLEARSDLEAYDETKLTPLGIAAQSGLKSIAEVLIRHKASPKVKSQGGMTPLHWASYHGHDEVVETLLQQKKSDIDANTDNNRTTLHLAAMGRSFGVIEKLLRAGANIEANCNRLFRPLHYACVHAGYSEASLLMNFGADVNATTTTGETPLHLAVEAGSIATVRGLLDRGGAVDIQNSQGTRALLIACKEGNLEIVHQLLDHGAKLNVALGAGQEPDTPVCVAASGGFVAVIQELIHRGGSVREMDSGGWQPLRHAAFKGHVEAVACLLGNGARATDLGPLASLSFASTATMEQISRILELLNKGIDHEQSEYQHVTRLASSATPINPEDPSELPLRRFEDNTDQTEALFDNRTSLQPYANPSRGLENRSLERENYRPYRPAPRNPEMQPRAYWFSEQIALGGNDSYLQQSNHISSYLDSTNALIMDAETPPFGPQVLGSAYYPTPFIGETFPPSPPPGVQEMPLRRGHGQLSELQ